LVLRPLFGLLYQRRMIDDDCGAVGGMRIGSRNRSTWRKPAPVPPCPPQIPHDLTRPRTRAAAVVSRRLIASAIARPQLEMVWTYIRKVLGSNLSRHTSYHISGFSWTSSDLSDHDRFYPHCFTFINHLAIRRYIS
jgi:hypothetical protein